MEFCVLGPIEARAGNKVVSVTGKFQRALLGSLLVSRDSFVSAEALITELWGETPPSDAENALQAHVSRLRRKLAELEPGSRIRRLSSWPSRYQLTADPGQVDAFRFARTLAGESERRHTDPAGVARALRAAQAEWRGPVFGGPVGGPICRTAAARLVESRYAALEVLYDAELAAGRHAEIVPELQHLVESELFHERLCEQLMVALYRSGRQADALAAYRRLRRRLSHEVGLQPLPMLRHCEAAILAHDAHLFRPAAS